MDVRREEELDFESWQGIAANEKRRQRKEVGKESVAAIAHLLTKQGFRKWLLALPVLPTMTNHDG